MPPQPANPTSGQTAQVQYGRCTLPEWVQDKLHESVMRRKTLLKQHEEKREAIKKLIVYKETETAPKSIIPNVQLHVSAKFQSTTDKYLENLNKEYTNNILKHLIDVRKKELEVIEKEKRDLRNETLTYIRTTIDEMKSQNLYKEFSGDDAERYMKIYDLENDNIAQEYKMSIFFKNKKKQDWERQKATESAQAQMDQEMTDPVQQQLDEIKKVLGSLQEKLEGKGQGQPSGPKRKTPDNTGNPGTKTPNGNRNNNPRKTQRNRNRNNQRDRNHRQNNQQYEDQEDNNRQNENGRGNGRRGRRHNSTNTTNRLGSRPRNSRRTRN